MEDGVTGTNVRQESVAKTLTLWRSLHKTSDVNHIQEGWHFTVNKPNYDGMSALLECQKVQCAVKTLCGLNNNMYLAGL